MLGARVAKHGILHRASDTLHKGPVYLCQRWIVEFKGIMQPVLFLIFFTDFVTPEKCTISEGCWLWHTPGYQQKFWPKTQFLKITGSGLNLELDAVLVILKTKFYKKKDF